MPKPPKGQSVKPKSTAVYWIIGTVILIIAVLFAAKVFLKPASNAYDNRPVPPATLAAFSNFSPFLFSAVGAGSAGNLPAYVKNAQPLQAGGKPEVLYVGADYCPYCAAERWALVLALSRFGQFADLHYMTSSASDVFPSSPTFTFYGSSYKSAFVNFQSVELEGNTAVNGSYPSLQKMTPAQSALVGKYDQGGGIPFVVIGGHYVLSGSTFNPGLLKGLTWDQIIAATHQPGSPLGQAILGSANVLAAAICASDGGKPASVCSDPGLARILASFPQK